MKAGMLYAFSIFQLIGFGLQCWHQDAGGVMILGGCLGQIVFISSDILERRKFKPCPNSGASVMRRLRICPECGYQFKKGLEESELMDYIEQERSEVDAMTPEEIDYNFERMEQFVLDEATSFDGDIQEFLDRRESGENTVSLSRWGKVSRM